MFFTQQIRLVWLFWPLHALDCGNQVFKASYCKTLCKHRSEVEIVLSKETHRPHITRNTHPSGRRQEIHIKRPRHYLSLFTRECANAQLTSPELHTQTSHLLVPHFSGVIAVALVLRISGQSCEFCVQSDKVAGLESTEKEGNRGVKGTAQDVHLFPSFKQNGEFVSSEGQNTNMHSAEEYWELDLRSILEEAEAKYIMAAPSNIGNLAEEVIYTALGHQDLETSRLPLNPNSLAFKDKSMDDRYHTRLLGLGDHGEMSLTFKNNVVFFGASLTLFCLVALVAHTVAHFRNDNLEQKDLFVHIGCLLTLATLGGFLTVGIWASLKIRQLSKRLCFAYCLMLSGYLILCDQRVLSGLAGSDYSFSHSDYTQALMLFLYLYMRISFAYFLGMVLLSAFVLVLYLCLMFSYSPQDEVATAANFIYLAIYCTLLCFHTHQTEFRARSLFYHAAKEEDALAPLPIDNKSTPISGGISTAAERLIGLCNSVKAKVKAAASVVMLSDVKTQLKEAIQQLDKIKQRLAEGKLNEVDRLDPDGNIDEEDQEFIRQQVGHKSILANGVGQLMSRLVYIARAPSEVKAEELGLEPGLGTNLESLQTVITEVGTNWGFDIWKIHQETGHSIALVGKCLFKKWELYTDLKIAESIAEQFFRKVEKSYNSNPYHNACHGADVCHTLMYFICTSNLLKSLTSLDLSACIIASLGHDINHPGLNNRFLVANKEKLAMRYNDHTVLENMHAALLYKIMQDPELNLLSGLKFEDWADLRKLIIDLILHTDMSKHFETLGQFRSRTQAKLTIDSPADKSLVLSMGLKCADVGHTAKPNDLHIKWSELVCEEFFNQGDMEKQRGQQVSMYCDRVTTDIAKSQAGFLKNITIPLFEAWTGFLDSPEVTQSCLVQMSANMKMWESKVKVKRVGLMLLTTLGGKMGGELKKNIEQAIQDETD